MSSIFALTIKKEFVKIYTVCRDIMLEVHGYGPWYRERIAINQSHIEIFFRDHTNTAECEVHRNNSEWEAEMSLEYITCDDCTFGQYGVIP